MTRRQDLLKRPKCVKKDPDRKCLEWPKRPRWPNCPEWPKRKRG